VLGQGRGRVAARLIGIAGRLAGQRASWLAIDSQGRPSRASAGSPLGVGSGSRDGSGEAVSA